MITSRVLKVLSVVGLTGSLVLVGCGDKANEQFNDAPRDSSGLDKSPARVLAFPDGFSNVARKCDGPNMVYVVFHNHAAYGSVAVVPNDSRCAFNDGGGS